MAYADKKEALQELQMLEEQEHIDLFDVVNSKRFL